MKMKSISGVTHYVKDMKKAAKFYEALGFQFRENKPDSRRIYVNWFWIELCFKKGTKVEPRDEDILLNIKVEDIDAYSGASWALIPGHRGHRFRNHRGQ